MSAEQPTIIYTLTDEAPLLATYAFLPIVRAFAEPAGIDDQDQRHLGGGPDPGRVLRLPDRRAAGARQPGRAGRADPGCRTPTSSSCRTSAPRCRSWWRRSRNCRARDYKIPDYPGRVRRPTRTRRSATRYAKCLGSAVNPVLREGNSDRRAPKAVKEYARKHPHSMGEWSQASRTHVANMRHGDFYHGEKSMTLDRARNVKMELETKSGETIVLKPEVKLRRRRRHRQHVHEQEGALRLLRGADGGRLQDRRHVLAARQGHDDEGLATPSSSATR